MANDQPHNHPRLGELVSDARAESRGRNDARSYGNVLGGFDAALRYMGDERRRAAHPYEQPGEPGWAEGAFPDGAFPDGADVDGSDPPDQVPPPMEHDPETPPPEWPHPEDEPEEPSCICHLECRPPWWQGTHVLPDDKTRCNLWADREPDQGNLVELWFRLSSNGAFPEDEVVITVSDPSAVALLKMNTQHRPAAEDIQRGVPEIRDRMPCPGGYTCFATGLKATPDPVTVAARWGALVCHVTLDVKEWQCSCDAYCVTVDEHWNIERADDCRLELAEPDPSVDPPVEATDVVAPIVVSFEGPSDRRVEWHAKSVNGYVEFAGNRDAPGFASGELNCGELDVFLVKPTALAAAELSVAATQISDVIEVLSSLGLCNRIEVAVGGRDSATDSSDNHGALGISSDDAPQFQLFNAAAESCAKNSVESCLRYFRGERNAKLDGSKKRKQSALAKVWNKICEPPVFDRWRCLDPLFRYTLIELCRTGWTISVFADPYADELDSVMKRVLGFPVQGDLLQVKHIEFKVELRGITPNTRRFIADSQWKWFVNTWACQIYIVPGTTAEITTRRLAEALQSLGEVANGQSRNMILKERLVSTRNSVNYFYNSWWSDIKRRDWRLVMQNVDSLPHDKSEWELNVLDPRNKGPLDYMWQVVRHNHRSGWSEWAGSGYHPKAKPDKNPDIVTDAMKATKALDTADSASSVFVFMGHSNPASLGGLALSRVRDACESVTGVVMLFGCYAQGIFGYDGFVESGNAAKPSGPYSKERDFFPNAEVKIAVGTQGGVVTIPKMTVLVRKLVELMQLDMGTRKLSWQGLVTAVNSEVGFQGFERAFLVCLGKEVGKSIWQPREK